MIKNFKYTDKELDELIKSIVILYDTREKSNQHILDYFEQKGIKYKKKALKQGDYSFYIPKNEALSIPRDLYFDSRCVVERKGSAEELSGNLTKDRDRLEKEFSICPAKMVLLIENTSYKDIVDGNYDTQYNRKSYWASLHSFWWKYDLPIFFMSDNKYSGLFIRGYFEYFLRNYIRS